MSGPDPVARLTDAELEVIVARERLNATVAKLQVKLNPRTLAQQAAREAASKGTAAAQASLNAAVRNPGPATITALAGLFLVRHRIGALFRRKSKPNRHVETGVATRS